MKYFRNLLILLLLISTLIDSSAASSKKNPSKEFRNSDFVFLVKSAVVFESAESDQRFLGIRYAFRNLTETRKLDLSEPFNFRLNDEFGNQYRRLPKPENYTEANSLPKNFPSVYPQDGLEEVVFFEPPIARSRFLTLSIGAQNIGLKEEVALLVPPDKIKNIAESVNDASRSKDEETMERAIPVPYAAVRIISPLNGSQVAPGQRIAVEVKVEDKALKPEAIMVIIPDYVLEDTSAAGNYDLIVPRNLQGDFSLVVIAKWRQGEREELTSDSILLNIVDPSVL